MSVTPKFGWPLPDGGDPLRDGYLDVTALGNAVDGVVWPQVCTLRQQVGQNLTSGTGAFVNLSSEIVDSNNMGNTPNDQIIIRQAGYYRLEALVHFAPNTVGYRRAALYVNGAFYPPAMPLDANQGAGVPTMVSINAYRHCLVGDTIKVQALQNSGAVLQTFVDGTYFSTLSAAMIGGAVAAAVPVP